jgi:hypothetical protein
MNTTPGIVLRSITVSLKRAGVAEFPAAFTEKLEVIARVDVANFPPYDASRLTSAVAAALIAKTNPATDPAVIEAFAEDQLAQVRKWNLALQDWRDREVSALLREWAPSLVAEWGGYVATAGKRLAGAACNLNLSTTLDAQSQAVLRVGGKAASAWHEAYLAVGVIDGAVDAQSKLIAFVESRTHADTALLACPEMTSEECVNLPDAPGRPGVHLSDAWTLACQGHEITGTDYEGYRAARIRNSEEIAAGRVAEAARQERGRVMRAW